MPYTTALKIYVAYAISVCEYILNPSNQQIQVSESTIKFLISKYLQKVLNKEKLVSSDEDDDINNSGGNDINNGNGIKNGGGINNGNGIKNRGGIKKSK